jgi:hypothetical protein
MNRREMIVGTTVCAAMIPLVGIEPAEATVSQIVSMSDQLVRDATYLGYIPGFFTADPVDTPTHFINDGFKRGFYKITFQRKLLVYHDPNTFQPWTRELSDNTSFTIERAIHHSRIGDFKCLKMKITDDGKYVATIIKLTDSKYRILTAINDVSNEGWTKVVWKK